MKFLTTKRFTAVSLTLLGFSLPTQAIFQSEVDPADYPADHPFNRQHDPFRLSFQLAASTRVAPQTIDVPVTANRVYQPPGSMTEYQLRGGQLFDRPFAVNSVRVAGGPIDADEAFCRFRILTVGDNGEPAQGWTEDVKPGEGKEERYIQIYGYYCMATWVRRDNVWTTDDQSDFDAEVARQWAEYWERMEREREEQEEGN